MSSIALPGADQPDVNRGPEILGSVITTTTLALVTVVLRILVRLRITKGFGLDDCVILAAMILSLSAMGIVIPEVIYGAGRHAAYLDPEVNRTGLKLNFMTQPIYLWAIPLVKISVGLFLLRISPNKIFTRLIQGTIGFLILFTIMSTLTLVLQCTNLSILWDSRVVSTCWPTETLQGLSYTNSAVNIITDFFFAFLPVPMLWNVQINTKKKASLVCILSLGIFASAAAIVKAVFISNYGKTGDFLWESTDLTIWISTEANTGIIAASLPCLKPIFKRLLDSSKGYASKSPRTGYQLHSYGTSNPDESKYGRTVTKVDSGSRRGRNKLSSDNSSEEFILHDLEPQTITKTTVFTVDRSSRQETGL